MMSMEGDCPVHWTTVAVMTPGFRVAVVGEYSPRAVAISARAARSPWMYAS